MEKVIPHQPLEPYRVVLVLTFIAIGIWYFVWRLGTFNPQAKVFSWLLYGAEAYGFATAVMHLFMTWLLTVRTAPPPAPNLSVDVFVPTINESADLVRNTLLACVNMDYPHQTWLLDDGNRAEMAALARALGCRYLTRDTNAGAKAGNLNHALQHSKADFIAVFDADHAPLRNFLTDTLGYFRDERVAFVQTPQDFFNLDSYQHRASAKRQSVWTEQGLFFRVIQRGKDFWNAAFFCGSCAVLRRKALDRIGGFAADTVTEDLHTSLKLHKQGFKSVYHADSLAFGLAPSSVVPFMKQRIRWGQGAMQVWRKEGILFTPGLSLAQRINYFASVLTYFDGWQKGMFYVAPVIVLAFGIMPISALGEEFLWHFIPYYLLTFWVFEEVGRGYGQTHYIEQYNMGRFAGFAWSTLGLFMGRLKFRVTPKGATPRQETYRFMTPQFLVFVFNGTAIPVGIALYLAFGHLPTEGLIANVVWAGVNLSLALVILLFTFRRSSFSRTEYRFPIPLPAKLKVADNLSAFVTVDNVSTAGCRLYGSFPAEFGRDAPIEGTILLPSGPLSFRGQVVALSEAEGPEGPYVKALGCRFEWDDEQQRDALKLFLYGSDLQWQLWNLRDRAKTPMEWFFGLANKRKLGDYAPEHWAAAVFKYGEGGNPDVKLGLISVSRDYDGVFPIIAFKPLPTDTCVRVRAFTRKEQIVLEGQVVEEQRLESPVAPLYRYWIKNTKNAYGREEWPTDQPGTSASSVSRY